MKAARFQVLVGMIIATSSLGARGLSCGPCGGGFSDTIPVLPPSDGTDAGTLDAGDYLATACERLCGGDECVQTEIETPEGPIPAVECSRHVECGAGRRPAGLVPPAEVPGDAVAAWLARAAFLEAASIDAFRLLRRDLAAHRAPRALLRGASRAARDERRHARRMTALARRRGAAVEAPITPAGPPPSIEALATQNAVEGCVREAFGAIVARYQAAHAADRDLAAALARIAVEEAEHAALSFQIDAWARRRLDRAARRRVDRARAGAARALLADAARALPEDLAAITGHPDAATAARLAQRMIEILRLA